MGTHVARSRCTLNHMITFNHSILEAALAGLETQKRRIDAQIAEVRAMLFSHPGQSATTPEAAPRQRRKFSAATRRRMKEAQRRRWAKIRGEAEPATPEAPKPKRRLSAAGRKAIVAAAKKRWALKRAEAAPKKIARKKAAVEKAAPAKTVKKSAPVEKPVVKTAKKTAPAPAVEQPAG